ncbi:MAG TPA: YkgJ family cysteine cluster protein, partial [Phycisphaerales bacterium]|nr:YkgJ family cysteine cluster protein [Phycisphaerales bacterium]
MDGSDTLQPVTGEHPESPASDPSAGTVEMVPVELTVLGGTLRATIPVPRGATTPGAMLDVFRGVAEAVIHLSVSSVQRQGRAISCRAGCGACCRQLVPISETEARDLIAYVEGLAEPRRSEIKSRFARAVERLDTAGMRDLLMAPWTQPVDAARAAGVEYFRLGIPCPFLENESCGIHLRRPIICREYLVTSPAERCANLDGVDGVRIPRRASIALNHLGQDPARSHT